MNNKEDLKSRINAANAAYRTGNAVMSDAEYDKLVDEFKREYPAEYDEFRNSLNDSQAGYGAKVRHPYIMGSLDKVTIEEPESIFKFVSRHVKTRLNVSAKVDGISCRLHYENGKLVQGSTRGDGTEGVDITDKIRFIKNVPSSICVTGEFDVRGELVIMKSDFENMTGFANPRNATAGIMNRKDWSSDDVSNVSFVAYTVLGQVYTKAEQFDILAKLGFVTAWNRSYDIAECAGAGFIDTLAGLITADYPYETDGLVLSDDTYRNETEYRPDGSVAVKGNMNSAVTKIIDVEWRGPSKDGFVVPVAQVEPVQLCGTVVSQATLHNLDYIRGMGLKYGSVVKIQKRGEIIPQITELISNDDAVEMTIPSECPCCGEKLTLDGVNMRCVNPDCRDQKIYAVTHFIKKLGVMNASFKTLTAFGVDSVEKLVKFIPDRAYKNQVKFYDELNDKVFTRRDIDLFCAMNVKDLGETLQRRIIEHYGWDNVKTGNFGGTLPDGIGQITLDKFKAAYAENLAAVGLIMSDLRYDSAYPDANAKPAEKKGSVCFTGPLATMGRKEAAVLAEKAGYEVKSSVCKGLTYLVTNSNDPNSSKGKKAKQLGIKIVNESEFLKLCSNIEQNILTL